MPVASINFINLLQAENDNYSKFLNETFIFSS